jgi:beta-glucosidase
MRSYPEAQSALSFDYKLDAILEAPLWLQVNCTDTCQSDIDLSSHMSFNQPAKWETISIDLTCFEQGAEDFSKVGIPFALRSAGILSLSLSNISIIPNAADKADVQCAAQ